MRVRKLLDTLPRRIPNGWVQQSAGFFEEATIEMDGMLVVTTGQCKEAMDISRKGDWGYHPLLVSLANTGEVLWLVNRSGNRPSATPLQKLA